MSTVSLALDNENLAERYDRISADRQFKSGQILIAALTVAPGSHVLDVGCGTGLLAEYVAGLVGADGSVVGIDPLPLRIELAKRKCRGNLSFQVGDANDLSAFPAERFDIVYLNAVFHWLPDKPGALRQFHSVLKPGGQLGISTGSRTHRSPLRALKDRVLMREPYGRFPGGRDGSPDWTTPEELGSLLGQAGFAPRIELRPFTQHLPSSEAAIQFWEASSFGNLLGHLPEDLRAAARDDLKRELEAMTPPEGVSFQSARIVGVATKI